MTPPRGPGEPERSVDTARSKTEIERASPFPGAMPGTERARHDACAGVGAVASVTTSPGGRIRGQDVAAARPR
jgi:hypothetical protein